MQDDTSRLRWLCRRGMKELDVVLTRYLEQHYQQADESERKAFAALLDMQDPTIYALLLGREHSEDDAISNLISRLSTHG